MSLISAKDFMSEEATKTNWLVDLYEGNQLEWLIKSMNGELEISSKREGWKGRGMAPSVRNIIKPLIEKSTGLFHTPPVYELVPKNLPDGKPEVNAEFNQLLTLADWEQFSASLDEYRALLKSVVVLAEKVVAPAADGGERLTVNGKYQFDPSLGDTLTLTLLHRGNSVVLMDQARTTITALGRITEGPVSRTKTWKYVVITPQNKEYYVVKNGKEVLEKTVPNPDGFVPAVMHYDGPKPRSGFWYQVDEALIGLQMAYNTWLTDTLFASGHQKVQMFVTNGKFGGQEEQTVGVVGGVQENAISPQTAGADQNGRGYRVNFTKQPAAMGGIGSILQLEAPREGTMLASFMGPDVDLKADYDLMQALVADVSQDFGVTVKTAGEGSASSGFQLVVEEIDYLKRCENRQKAFNVGLRALYDVIQRLYPTLPVSDLYVKWAKVRLPVDTKGVLAEWKMKFELGLASVVDYFMAEEGLSEPEAIKKAQLVKATQDSLYPPEPKIVPGQAQ